MKKQNKIISKRFNPFKPTIHKVLILAVFVQFALMGALGFLMYEWWEAEQTESNNNTIKLIRESNDRLYDLAMQDSVMAYGSNEIKWPEYGLLLPKDNRFGEIYLSSWIGDDYTTSEINISNDYARDYVGSKYETNFEKTLTKTVPIMQACTRMVLAVPKGSTPSFDDYTKQYSKIFKDGRAYDFYSNDICNPDNKDEFINYVQQLDSL